MFVTTISKGNTMQRTSIRLTARAALVATLLATGAAPFVAQAAPDHHPRAQAECRNCATVVSNHTYKREPAPFVAQAAGAVGGAYGGNRIERNMKAETYTDVRVKMAAGGYRTFTEKGVPRFHNGEHVRVLDGRLVR